MTKAADDNGVTRQTVIGAPQQRKNLADSQGRGFSNGQGAAANGRTDEDEESLAIAAGYENTFPKRSHQEIVSSVGQEKKCNGGGCILAMMGIIWAYGGIALR
jgi:hypothetical protein